MLKTEMQTIAQFTIYVLFHSAKISKIAKPVWWSTNYTHNIEISHEWNPLVKLYIKKPQLDIKYIPILGNVKNSGRTSQNWLNKKPATHSLKKFMVKICSNNALSIVSSYYW